MSKRDKSVTPGEETLHERVQKFINSDDYPDNLRRNASIAYHPDVLPDNLKQQGGDILGRINNVCDEIEQKKK